MARRLLWCLLLLTAMTMVLVAVSCARLAEETPPAEDVPSPTSCTITYYTYDNVAATQAVSVGQAYTLTVPERMGYVFLGYYDEPTGGVQYVDRNGRSVAGLEMVTDTFRLFGRWSPLQYTLRFDAAEGETDEASVALTFDESVPLFATARREHYDFAGWYTPGGTQIADEYGDCLFGTMDADFAALFAEGKLTVIARYTPKVFRLTFAYNDGSGRSYGAEAPYGAAIADYAPTLTETDGAVFDGWTYAPAAAVAPLGLVTQSETYYAVWTAYRTVAFYRNPGDDEPALCKRVYADGRDTAFPTEKAVIKKGYKLVEWYDNPTYSGVPSAALTYVGAENRYYAKWEETAYSVHFVSASGEVDDLTYRYGDNVALPDLEWAGHTFEGWSRYADYSGDLVAEITTEDYGDMTLYAVFTPNVYRVTLRKHNGEGDLTVRLKYGQSYTLAVPERAGYDFLGWYDQQEGGNLMATETGHSVAAYATVGDTLYHAQWQAKRYHVTYVLDNGDPDLVVEAVRDQRLTPPEDPVKTGSFFNGWYDETYRNEFRFDVDTVVGDTVLYASWIQSVGISSPEGFAAMAQNVNANYHLECDINMGGAQLPSLAQFGGRFNGQGYAVYNFAFEATTAGTGVFGANRGVVKNVTFRNFTADLSLSGDMRRSTGDVEADMAFVAGTNEGTISGVTVANATLSMTDSPVAHPGGTIDVYYTYRTLYWSVVTARNVGTVTDCRVEDCVVSLNVLPTVDTASSFYRSNHNYCLSYYGAIAGANDGTIDNCLSSGDVRVTLRGERYNDGSNTWCNAYAQAHVGGVCGGNLGVVYGCSSQCAISVNATGNTANLQACGVAGLISKSVEDATVEACYATGSVSVTGGFDPAKLYAGGLVQENGGTVRNSYATTSVSVGCNLAAAGFVARNGGTVRNCYSAVSLHLEGTVSMGASAFAGYAGEESKIVNSFSVGELSSTDNALLGYFAGDSNARALYTNCAYDANMNAWVSGGVAVADPSGVVPMGRVRILVAAFLADNLFFDEAIWLVEDGALPTLRWAETNE